MVFEMKGVYKKTDVAMATLAEYPICHRKQFGDRKQVKSWLGVGYSVGYEIFYQ
jgi:hypothetical protein